MARRKRKRRSVAVRRQTSLMRKMSGPVKAIRKGIYQRKPKMMSLGQVGKQPARFYHYGRSVKTTRRRSYKMARRKKKRYSRRKGGGILGKITPEVKGVLGVIAYDTFLSPKIPLNGTVKDLAELGAGAFMARKAGWLGATGKTLMVLNLYQLGVRARKQFLGNGGITNGQGLFDGGGM